MRDHARRDGFTGGALKNLLHQCLDPVAAAWNAGAAAWMASDAPAQQTSAPKSHAEMQSSAEEALLNAQLRKQISTLTRQVTALLNELHVAKEDISGLEKNLSISEQRQLELQDAAIAEDRRGFQNFVVHALWGAAAMAVLIFMIKIDFFLN